MITLVGLTGCGQGSSNSGSGGGGEKGGETLTILAASSLIDAFGELGKSFEEQNEGVTVKQSFESSSTLLTQIKQGAPADVFASAAQEEMNTAVEDGLVAGRPEVFVENREIIMVPKDNPAGIKEFRDVAKLWCESSCSRRKTCPLQIMPYQILDKANSRIRGQLREGRPLERSLQGAGREGLRQPGRRRGCGCHLRLRERLHP